MSTRTIERTKSQQEHLIQCPLEAAVSKVGGKWKVLILVRLFGRTWRFNELLRSLGGCSQRMLTNQLRELERDQLVLRKVYPEVPPRVEYSLTEIGKELEPVLKTMAIWGRKYMGEDVIDFEELIGSFRD